METQTIISAQNLTKHFGEKAVIKNCSMNVKQGKIYALLGANGAGKTTIFKMLTGLLVPSSGRATIFGKDMVANRRELQREIGSIIETPIFYEHLTAKENLEIHLAYMDMPCCGIDEVLGAVGLHGIDRQIVAKFSLGMRQRLGIARAILHKPQLLILDEPINGLDPMGIKEMRTLMLNLAHEDNITILISSHILSEIEQIADEIGIIANGELICELPMADAKASANGNTEDYFLELMSGGAHNA